MSTKEEKHRRVRKRLENHIFLFWGVVIFIPLIFLIWFLFPYMLIVDTIKAKGGIVWYRTVGYRQLNNYQSLGLSAFLWLVAIITIRGRWRGKRKKKQLDKHKQARIATFSEEEKAVQIKMDKTLENISFHGVVPETSSKGLFSCDGCGHEWEAPIAKIYSRKQCSSCGISYRKEE